MDDFELLQAYAQGQGEDAFTDLVRRYINLVYSAALRQMREPHAAEEVTQAVFIILARKAAAIRRGTLLPGWLLRTTRYAVANARRCEQRRQRREREAMNQLEIAQSGAAWEHIGPVLDEALLKLGEQDRNALALHYFQQKTYKEVGLAMGLTEDSARMRVSRALERLRTIFTRRGLAVSAAGLGVAISASGLQAAPPELIASVTLAAVKQAGVTPAVSSLITQTLELVIWTKIKAALGSALATLLVVGSAWTAMPFLSRQFESPNLVRNGSFEDGMKEWYGYADRARGSRATFALEKFPGHSHRSVHISVLQGSYFEGVEFHQGGISVKEGAKYTISFRARSSVPQPIRVKIRKYDPPWTFYGYRVIAELTPQWQTFHLTGRSMVTANDGKLIIACGATLGDIWIEDIKFTEAGRG